MRKTLTSFLAMMIFAVICRGGDIADNPDFVIGHLDNGLTYYLYHNDRTPGTADFYIAHNVGALQEEDNQNGLAHFLEHMAFNGTRHYPDKQLLEFLGREGVRFGYNVNAYTSRTETVYNISAVPVVRESFADSVLLVLRDWSCDISCEQEALDGERGVIHEEWRRRDGQRYRMMVQQTGVLYKGCKHTERTVLGDMNVVLNFKRDEILDFYHKWYRPDLQAIIIVGDIDTDIYAHKIRQMFGDIPAAVNAPAKEDYTPVISHTPSYEIMADPQLKFQTFKIYFRSPYPDFDSRSDEAFFKEQLCRQIVTSVMSDRLTRDCMYSGSPAKSAVLVSSDYAPDFFLSQFTINPQGPGKLADCLRLCERSIQTMLRYGISREEFEMAKYGVAKRFRLNNDGEATGSENGELVKVCIESFLRGAPCILPNDLKLLKSRILSDITYDEIKAYPSKMFDSEVAVYGVNINSKDTALAPTQDQVFAIVDEVSRDQLEPAFLQYDNVTLDVSATEGVIVREKIHKGGRVYEWTLGNGAKVWLRHSEPVKGDTHLWMEYKYDTSRNAAPADEAASLSVVNSYMRKYFGFRGHDRASLMNTPSQAGITYWLTSSSGRYSTLSVSSDRSHVDEAFRLAYIQLTEPYFNTEEMFEKVKHDLMETALKERKARDRFIYESDWKAEGHHPWDVRVDSAAVARVDMEYVRSTFEKWYGDPSRLTLYICSDSDVDNIRQLVAGYVASLPAPVEKHKYGHLNSPAPTYKGLLYCSEANKAESAPVCDVSYRYKIHCGGSRKECITIDMLDYIMTSRCIARIREERGGTYHVHFGSELYRSRKLLESAIEFQTRPQLRDILLKDVEDLMAQMCAEGPTQAEMDEAKAYFAKTWRNAAISTTQSLSRQYDQLVSYARWGVDWDEDKEALLAGVKATDIQKLARKLAKGDRYIRVYVEN